MAEATPKNQQFCDHLHDVSGKLTHEATLDIAVPLFVQKRAAGAERPLLAGDFACPSKRLFPIHTAEDTWLSTVLFLKQAEGPLCPQDTALVESTADRLRIACLNWGITDTFHKNAEAPSAPAPVMATLELGSHGQIELRTADDYKAAADELVTKPWKYPWSMRKTAAGAILATGSQHLDPITIDSLQQTAGMGETVALPLLSGIAARLGVYARLPLHHKKAEAENHDRDFLTELHAKLCRGDVGAVVRGMDLQKAASAIDRLDRAADIHRQYDSGYQPPERFCFVLTPKTVEEATKRNFITVGGRQFARSAVQKYASGIADAIHAPEGLALFRLEDRLKGLSAGMAAILAKQFPELVA